MIILAKDGSREEHDIWLSDGTESGTSKLTGFNYIGTTVDRFDIKSTFASDNYIFFLLEDVESSEYSIAATDGTIDGSKILFSIENFLDSDGYGNFLLAEGDETYYAAYNDNNSYTLLRTGYYDSEPVILWRINKFNWSYILNEKIVYSGEYYSYNSNNYRYEDISGTELFVKSPRKLNYNRRFNYCSGNKTGQVTIKPTNVKSNYSNSFDGVSYTQDSIVKFNIADSILFVKDNTSGIVDSNTFHLAGNYTSILDIERPTLREYSTYFNNENRDYIQCEDFKDNYNIGRTDIYVWYWEDIPLFTADHGTDIGSKSPGSQYKTLSLTKPGKYTVKVRNGSCLSEASLPIFYNVDRNDYPEANDPSVALKDEYEISVYYSDSTVIELDSLVFDEDIPYGDSLRFWINRFSSSNGINSYRSWMYFFQNKLVVVPSKGLIGDYFFEIGVRDQGKAFVLIDMKVHITDNPINQNNVFATKEHLVNIFPNPSREYLNINIPFNYTSLLIDIYSLDGKLQLNSSSSMYNENILLNISNLERGVYLLKISVDNENITKRFILKDLY